jgi:hypothetical protein
MVALGDVHWVTSLLIGLRQMKAPVRELSRNGNSLTTGSEEPLDGARLAVSWTFAASSLSALADLAPSRPSNDVAAQHREAATSSDDGRGSKVSAVESDYRWDLLSTALPTGRAVLTLRGASRPRRAGSGLSECSVLGQVGGLRNAP